MYTEEIDTISDIRSQQKQSDVSGTGAAITTPASPKRDSPAPGRGRKARATLAVAAA